MGCRVILSCGRGRSGLFCSISLIQFTTGFKSFRDGIEIFPSLGDRLCALLRLLKSLCALQQCLQLSEPTGALSLPTARMSDFGIVWKFSLFSGLASGFMHLKSLSSLLPCCQLQRIAAYTLWRSRMPWKVFSQLSCLTHQHLTEIVECLAWVSSVLLPYSLFSPGCLPCTLPALLLCPQALAHCPQHCLKTSEKGRCADSDFVWGCGSM